MPYENNTGLPDAVRSRLPKHAQTIYREAFNSAWDQYADPEARRGESTREEVAHRVAWSAVKQRYEKRDGEWRERDDG
jgi:cation transport regulator